MQIEVDMNTLREIENSLEGLTEWCINTYSDPSAAFVTIQFVLDGVDKIKKELMCKADE